MVASRYFNKGVMAIDAPHVGWVVRETDSTIVVFGEGDDRFDIPKDKIRFASRNVLIDLPFYEIARRYKVSRDTPLPTDVAPITPWPKEWPPDVDLATYEGRYPKSLFNKGVRTQDEVHIGHVMKETDDKIVVYGHYDWRFDVPKSNIIAVGRNVILGMDYHDVFQYRVDRNAPLPTGEAVDRLGDEEATRKQKSSETSVSETHNKTTEWP